MTKTKTYKEDELPEKFAQRIGLKFNDPMLLCRALTHRSFLNEHPDAIEDNERLEFLGDAILDFIVGAWLYNELPEMPEGELTKYRAALVHTEQLAEFAKQIGLGQALRLGKGELQAGGKTKPALLCDAFEALIGALYLDQGIDAVQNFILPMISESFEDIVSNHKGEDPKSRLQEIIQAENLPIPQYVVVNELGPDHSKIYEIEVMVGDKTLGKGSGSSKQSATKKAAQDALTKLGYGL
ncbi:MAG TPA: ribonuclease III [Flexilinea sp.]|mgnify:FL=1|jgi:ribonuclease-3|nr:MAG: Ribonuclease 3 [Chloroflexi bacterium ADurb.Bin344]HNY94351.1 ribonuclease III [Flexilinea sp.]HOG21664.1 ribonuclease III [Flexilinea sp.]HOP01791.1 ribonuclease III [Flexilinea sp.]HOR55900.1 ribonuclease III [Flexilinea sp.]